jgi:hypothetical protein
MAGRPTARDMERIAAARLPQRRPPPAPPGNALSMLVRCGLRRSLSRPDVPFSPDIPAETAEELIVLPTAEAIKVLEKRPKKTNAVLHVTC